MAKQKVEVNKYQNISGVTQNVIGFGVVEPEGIIETKATLLNPNFKKLEKSKSEQKRLDSLKS